MSAYYYKNCFQAAKNCTEYPVRDLPLQEIKTPFLDEKIGQLKTKKSHNMSLVKNVITVRAEENSVLNRKMGAIFRKNNVTSKLAKSLAYDIVFSATPSNLGRY